MSTTTDTRVRSSIASKLLGAEFARRNILLIGLIVLVIAFQSINSVFLTVGNVRGILLDLSILLILSVPAGLLLIAGYVDFSVGSVIGLSGVTAGLLMTKAGVPVIPAILLTLLVAAAVGALNAYLVTILGFSPIIVTFGTLALVSGITLGIGAIPTVGYPEAFQNIGGAQVAGVPVPVLIALAVLLVGAFVMWKLPVGRHIYAIGSNREAAYLSALKVRSIPFGLYVLTAVAAGLGGIIMAARLNTASSGTGSGFEVTLLTALLLGGISFFGGSGSLFGVVVGVLFLGVLQNGLVVLGAPSFAQQAATGIVLLGAAALNYLSEKRR
ncbi:MULTISPECIES: ABC transporter permease [unclassified Leucobacter]|uniref:ABC transporter permease n=1 Tax=unclassified Leucobacter TaxID=2621730 RepID=UPI00165D649D|nr:MULTISPECIES: ABC transporter permease [unclassified Leucobacter]MBC9928377.1 ABC transporter permease [Leucobacter sp. cx-169]MBC9936128.1 ABC transporter permease [Leucobacter sp. cx-87]